jgi:hypothetical protein
MLPLELFLCLFGGGFGDLMNKNSKGINYTFTVSGAFALKGASLLTAFLGNMGP